MAIPATKDNTDIQSSFVFRLVAVVIFALSFPLITILIHMNPSEMPPGTPFAGWKDTSLIIGLTFLFVGGVGFWLIRIRRKNIFLIVYCFSFIVNAGGAAVLGLNLHRDYFTSFFQLILIYWLFFILKTELFTTRYSKKHFYTFLFILNTVIFSMALVWIMFMGYAISTRQEPRWEESLVYNAYNIALLFFLGAISLRLQLGRFRNVRISGNDLYFDNWNFSRYFSDLEKAIIIRFFTAEGNITCGMLEDIIRKASNHDTEIHSDWNCGECLERNYTATRCPKYKNLYNRILNIKKLFETLEIGAIIAPENKMRIKEEGWKLRLFDDIRVVYRQEKTP